MPFVLEFENLTKEYSRLFGRQQVVALDHLSLTVEQGEIFGFLGPNGAGKTTAIHLAMGFMRATSGSGRMLGKPFGDPKTRRRVGFLAENVALYHRPAQQLVRFYGALNGMKGETLKAGVREVLEAVRLADVAKRNASKFSRGMLQRVGLAQAMVNDPDVLILDEPTSALDPLARVNVRELLLRARARGKTVFLSSHLLSEVEQVCDRIAMLNRGKLVRLGKTSDLLQSGGQAEVVARHIRSDTFAGAKVSDGVVRFQVPATELRATLERVWGLGGEIVSANPKRRSLEELFLEVTGESDPASHQRTAQ
jgi:ABC-2 type transport system ATP-binding protein